MTPAWRVPPTRNIGDKVQGRESWSSARTKKSGNTGPVYLKKPSYKEGQEVGSFPGGGKFKNDRTGK